MGMRSRRPQDFLSAPQGPNEQPGLRRIIIGDALKPGVGVGKEASPVGGSDATPTGPSITVALGPEQWGGQGPLGQQVGTLIAELLSGSPQSVESHPGKQLWADWLRCPQEECLGGAGCQGTPSLRRRAGTGREER